MRQNLKSNEHYKICNSGGKFEVLGEYNTIGKLRLRHFCPITWDGAKAEEIYSSHTLLSLAVLSHSLPSIFWKISKFFEHRFKIPQL